MAKSKQALPLRSKVNAAMKAAYVALYAQLGRQRPARGTEASAPLDAWTTAQVLDLEMPDSLGLTEQRAGGMAWLESKQNANGSWTGQLFRRANGDVPATAGAVRALSVGDREALLLHLRLATLGERIDCVAGCPDPACGERLPEGAAGWQPQLRYGAR